MHIKQLLVRLFAATPLPSPRITGEPMPGTIVFSVDFPAVVDPDVVKRRVRVTDTGTGQVIDEREVTPDVNQIADLRGPQGANVHVDLADIDDAGNETAYTAGLDFQLQDTFPPAINDAGMTGTVVAEE